MTRTVAHRYVDPLAQVWIATAQRLGLRVARTQEAYAVTDGAGTLALAEDRALDADDSLAQMIFHELCHSLVEGEAAFARPDWGMDNTEAADVTREHACLRVQWVLSGRHGVRAALAPTTDFRSFWDQLEGDVLAERNDPSVIAAILALRRVEHPPWGPWLGQALAASAHILRTAAPFTRGELAPPIVWSQVETPVTHPSGLPPGAARATCGACAWRFERRGRAHCRQCDARVDDRWPSCERFEPALDCQTCGACCREAYQSVEVSRRDPVVKAHPDHVVDRGPYLELLRSGDQCAALVGDPVSAPSTRYACTIYPDRPRTCRDFTLGSTHCLTARRRVGMSL